MDASIFAILVQDGITSGAVYALLALGLVLVFSVTRVIFIPLGEFVSYSALTLAAMQAGKFPAAALLLLGVGVIAFLQETFGLANSARRDARRPSGRSFAMALGKFIFFPLALLAAAWSVDLQKAPMLLQMALTLAIVTPLGPMLYRVAFQPLAEASVLVLLIVSVGTHFAMLGIGLVLFGAEGSRTAPFSDARFALGALAITGQSIAVLATALMMIAALYFYFDRTLSGKALRATAVNRLGAQLVGIGTASAGRLAFTFASALGGLCGVLIAPLTTIYYDSGFLIGLKGFVAAIIGGLASYPLAAVGALLVGLLEAFSSFWASAFKEAIVFTLIIPVLLWRSIASPHVEDEE
ncbi:amino acid/amide ABC transporter membrane protein 1, HAAT family [Noviherbaspirillum humi]|uniref:Amino acid/amide ABC transporter membrane protein 1, HAAT family n=1 Tax=Noviherbaspirillum humi TaxID=1688639 RepID=A0A239K332_9BURK|nr:branched-chain amino acid ABC transporter permease [Noviherbaspirillum humi]SNT12776.1 amino acid/amide ABC transporter membrane protein 1, HAAT family [Noviherbaspirillum humi]